MIARPFGPGSSVFISGLFNAIAVATMSCSLLLQAAGLWLTISTTLRTGWQPVLTQKRFLMEKLLVREKIRAVVERSQMYWLTLKHFSWADDITHRNRR